MAQFPRVAAKVEEFVPEHVVVMVPVHGGTPYYACRCRSFLTNELALVAKHVVKSQKAV